MTSMARPNANAEAAADTICRAAIPRALPDIAPASEAIETARDTFERVTYMEQTLFPDFGDLFRNSERDRLAADMSARLDELADLEPATLEDDPAFMRALDVLERQASAFEAYMESAQRDARRASAFSAISLAVALASLVVTAISLLGQFGVI